MYNKFVTQSKLTMEVYKKCSKNVLQVSHTEWTYHEGVQENQHYTTIKPPKDKNPSWEQFYQPKQLGFR